MKVPAGHTLVVNPHTEEEKKMTFTKGQSRRNPGAKDLAMTAAEGLGIGLVAAGINYGVAKLQVSKPKFRGHAVGLSQMATGLVAGALIDQYAGRRDVAVGVAASLSAFGFRDEWAYMQAKKALDAASREHPPLRPGDPGYVAPVAPGNGAARGLPAGNVVPANPFAVYYR